MANGRIMDRSLDLGQRFVQQTRNNNDTNISVGQKATYATEKCFKSQSNEVFFLHKLGTGEHANIEGERRRESIMTEDRN